MESEEHVRMAFLYINYALRSEVAQPVFMAEPCFQKFVKYRSINCSE